MKKNLNEESFKNFVGDQLAGLKEVRLKRMFGAYGLYLGPAFFGILDEEKLYFKTTPETAKEYLARQSKPFTYLKKKRSGKGKDVATLKNYYEVPADILEDRSQLQQWAQIASQVNLRS